MTPDELPDTWTEHTPGPDCIVFDPSAGAEPPRVLGFTHAVLWRPETREVLAVALVGQPEADVERALNGPLLWEGDQA